MAEYTMDSMVTPAGDLQAPQAHLNWIDFLVIAGYFVFVIAVGLWSSRSSGNSGISGYFLAARQMHWIPVGASLFASNIGSGHFIGLAGSGAATGIAIAGFELNAQVVLLILGWLFVPVYTASGVFTMPEYMKLRFGGQRIRIYLAVLALLIYAFTKTAADLYAGAIFIKVALGFSGDEGLYLSVLILLGIAGIFTAAGGLTTVIWTDFVQTILMIAGALVLMAITFVEVGGYSELLRRYMSLRIHADDPISNGTCISNIPPADALHLIRGIDSDMPWPGLGGLTVSALWYWCSDQVIVQRTMAAKDISHAKAACVFAGILKLLPLFALVLPGMAARVLFPARIGCSTPDTCIKTCGSPAGCTNLAYAELVLRLMPAGLSGLMLAVMMAALTSSLTSVFNSASTVFTMDLWRRFRPRAKQVELLLVGKCSVIGLVAVSVLWVPVILRLPSAQLFVYIQQVSNFLAPPVAAVYIMAILWSRATEPAAFWGLAVGLVLGGARFALQFGFPAPICGESGMELETRPGWIRTALDMHYLNFGGLLFLVTLLIIFVVSLLTEPIPLKHQHRLTFWTRKSLQVREPLEDEEQEEATLAEPTLKTRSCWKRVLLVFCGLRNAAAQQDEEDIGRGHQEESTRKTRLTPEEEARVASKLLTEDPFWRRSVDTSAVLLLTLSAFVWGFYA